MFVYSLPTPFIDSCLSKGPAERGNLNQSQRQLDGHHTPGIAQGIPIAPGPPYLEQCAHALPVRVLTLVCTYILSYRASDCRMLPTTAGPVTFLFLTT